MNTKFEAGVCLIPKLGFLNDEMSHMGRNLQRWGKKFLLLLFPEAINHFLLLLMKLWIELLFTQSSATK